MSGTPVATIEWNGLGLPEWQARFDTIRRANLLQSYEYAQAACPYYHQKARWGLIKIDGREAGLVQILEAGLLWNLVHAVILDCGPLWFDGFGGAAHIQAFFAAFAREFPRRRGRKRRILPDVADGPAIQALLRQLGYIRQPTDPYQTVWLDLTRDLEILQAEMSAKWRNKIRKGQRSELRVEWDEDGAQINWLLNIYQQDKEARGYEGPSPSLLRHLCHAFVRSRKLMIGRAMLGEKPVAAVLLLCHGKSVTYQAGWNGREGRERAAHNLLLWEAVQRLKDKGFKDLDLGGMNDTFAKAVKDFKKGMGGQMVKLAGHYS